MENKKISSSEELNKYYKIVNAKLKKYSDMEISPVNIYRYLKPGSDNFTKFISEDDDLKNVDGIEVVLKDIILDTYNAFKDGLIKKMTSASIKNFEAFKCDINIFQLDISDSDIHNHEKALADIYKISISYINIINKDLHLYSINDNGEFFKIMIFSKDEISKIRENILNEYENYLKRTDIHFINGKEIKIGEIINNVNIKEEINKHINLEDIIETISVSSGMENKLKYIQSYELNSTEYYLFGIISQ